MTPLGEHSYLVSNFREALSILENLRVSPVPGRGMRHLRRRPVVDALRAAEAEEVTGGLAGEFPVLCRVGHPVMPAGEPFQRGCVPLSRIAAFVFASEADRELFTGKLLENASVEGRSCEVVPDLFGHPGPPRFQADRRDRTGKPEPGWTRADALAGAAGAVLALCRRRTETASAARAFLLGNTGLPISLRTLAAALDAPEGPWAEGGVAASAVALALKSARGQDPLDALEMLVAALGGAGYRADRLAKFREYVTDIVTDQRPRNLRDLADTGDILLRALLLFVQRDRLDEILDDTADGVPPGPSVHLAAMALCGMREGLARMPSSLKSPFADALGEFAAAIEDDPAASPVVPGERLAGLLPQEAPPEPAPAPPESAPRPPALPSVADLVHQLEAAASKLGLVNTQAGEGIVGTCPSTQLVARIAPMSIGDPGLPGPVLLVSVGAMEDSALLREALKGAVRAWRGSFLCLPEGAERVELASPVGLANTGELPGALACNVEVVRQWRTAAAEIAEVIGEKPVKGRRGATKGASKGRRRASASGAGHAQAPAGETAAPTPSGGTETGPVQPEGSTADPPVAPARKRPSARRSTKRKAAPELVQNDLLAGPPEAPRPAAEPAAPAAAGQTPDAPEEPEAAVDPKPGGAGW